MIVSLFSPTPQFANDLFDVVRIFWGGADCRTDGTDGDVTIRHTEKTESAVRTCRIEMTGAHTGAWESSRPVGMDPLLDKRYHKRQIKQALYEVMKRAAGRTPPWGSLTGIRPTRLLYEGMSRGLTLEEAAEETRREFDVRTDKAELLREIVLVQSGMPAPSDQDVDLYVGIPFCVSRCAYCSFLSGEVGKG